MVAQPPLEAPFSAVCPAGPWWASPVCWECQQLQGIPRPRLLHPLPRARPSSILISLAELSHHREVLEVGDFHKAKPLNPRAASLSS